VATTVVGALVGKRLQTELKLIPRVKPAPIGRGQRRGMCDANEGIEQREPSIQKFHNAMLRISISHTEKHSAIMHLEGQIVGAWIVELERACREVLQEGAGVTLDLGDVTMIDREGIALLIELTGCGVKLARCSPFQEEQLRLAAIPRRDITAVIP
jgi:ABC-type transporter Mla MlaB component